MSTITTPQKNEFELTDEQLAGITGGQGHVHNEHNQGNDHVHNAHNQGNGHGNQGNRRHEQWHPAHWELNRWHHRQWDQGEWS